MSQSSIIAAALLVGFVVFIALRGELPAYLHTIGLGPMTNADAEQLGVQQGLSSGLGALPGLGTLM